MIAIIAKPEVIAQIRNEELFVKLILLMRIASAIRYNNILQMKIMEDEKYSVSLHFYLISNHVASLYEGIKKFFSLGFYLKGLSKYSEDQDKINKIAIKMKNNESYFNRVLKPIRNEIAFHFNEEEIRKYLIEYLEECGKGSDDIIIVSGTSRAIIDTSYDFTDNIIINYSLDKIAGKDLAVEEKVKRFSEDLVELSNLFLEVLDDLISEIFAKYNFVVRE